MFNSIGMAFITGFFIGALNGAIGPEATFVPFDSTDYHPVYQLAMKNSEDRIVSNEYLEELEYNSQTNNW